MASSTRVQQVSDMLQQEISMLLISAVKDPRLTKLSITGVEVSKDLAYAKVYFSSWQGEDLDSVAKALGKAKGFLRSSIGKKCRLRVTPALTFVHDDSAQKGAAIDALLAKALGKK